MNPSIPKAVAIQWFERVWQKRSKEAIYELIGEETLAHQPGGGVVKGPAEFDKFHDQILAGLPDQELRVLHVVGDDHQACLHWEVSVTHTGSLFGLAPTQKKVRFDGMTFVTVADGKVTEGWDCWDMGSLMANLSQA